MFGIILLISLVLICVAIMVYVVRDMSKSIKEYNQEEKLNSKEAKKRARRRQIYHY